jgi:hypothetical protein
VRIVAMLVALGGVWAVAYTIVNVVQAFTRSRTRGGDPALEERVARLEHTIEGLTVENQRLADGQRFFTQLLAERPVPAIAAGPRSGGPDGVAPRR